jgi:ABC-type glycerol-3-phosphate transport system substrate-binding protein
MSRRVISRRRALWIAGMGALAPVLAACGAAPTSTPAAKEPPKPAEAPKPTTAPAASGEAPKPVEAAKPAAAAPTPAASTAGLAARTIEIKMSTDFNTGIRKQFMDMLKQQFEAKHPNVKVTNLHMGSGGTTGGGGYNDVLVPQLLTGTAPDVIHAWGSMIVERGELMADVGDEAKKRGFVPDDYVWTADRNAHYDAQGRLKGMPLIRAASGWVYNKTTFEKAGMKPPTEEWTWHDLTVAAKALTKAQDKEWGVLANPVAWNGGYWEIIWAETGRMRDGKRTTMSDGSGPDAFQMYVDWIFKDKVSPDPGATRAMLTADVTSPFATGKLAMAGVALQDTSGLEGLIKNRFEWSIMPTPKSPWTGRRAYNSSGEVVTFLEESKKRGTFESGVGYYFSILDDEMQQWIAKNRPTLPQKKKFLSTPEFLAAPPLNREQLAKNMTDKGEHLMFRGFFKGFDEWQLAIHREVSKAFTGEVPPKDALAAGCKAGDAVLARAEL